jgi:hypothetical protein
MRSRQSTAQPGASPTSRPRDSRSTAKPAAAKRLNSRLDESLTVRTDAESVEVRHRSWNTFAISEGRSPRPTFGTDSSAEST